MKLYPKEHFKRVEQITISFLQKNKIKALILDVDNTLIDYQQRLEESVINWAKELKKQKINLIQMINKKWKK